MISQTSCLEPARLQALLDGYMPAEEEAACKSHLDNCQTCRLLLEKLSEHGASLPKIKLEQEQAPGNGKKEEALVLQKVLSALRGAAGPDTTQADSLPAAEVSFDFLAKTDKPGYIGRLGHYEIIELIGKGGMGIVFKAFDTVLQRVVAVKVLSPVLAACATSHQRFLREARAAAAVCHDHVVTIHAVEEQNGLPYLVMQYIAGVSLHDKLKHCGPLGVKEVLRIGLQAAQGLAAAHAHGLVHRDVKPANILLENGVERVKLTDFGLARAIDDASVSQSGVVTGTPQYMAPEQARGEPVSPRTDLFSLGGVMYATCTGQPPFKGSTSMSVLKRVCDENPRPIRDINPDVPDWLGEIICKLMAKAPADRHPSATDVAELLQQHLAALQQPTEMNLTVPTPCLPLSRRRRRWQIGTALVATLLFAIIASVWYWFATDKGDIMIQREDPDVQIVVKQGDNVVATLDGKDNKQATLPTGEYTLSLAADADVLHLDPPAISLRRGHERIVTIKRLPPGEITRWQAHAHLVHHLALSPDGRTLASASKDRTVRLWNVDTGKVLHTLESHNAQVNLVALSPDGTMVASCSRDKTVKWWDVTSGKLLGTFEGHTEKVMAVVFAADGKSLFSAGSDKTLRRVDLITTKEKVLETFPVSVRFLARHGSTLAVSIWSDSLVRLWDTDTEMEKAAAITIEGAVAEALAFDAKGQLLAEGGYEPVHLALWETSGKLKFNLAGHQRPVIGVAFSPDSKLLVSVGGQWNRADLPGEIKVWDTSTGKLLENLGSNLDCVFSVVVAANGKTCFTAHHDGTIRKWRLPPAPKSSLQPPAPKPSMQLIKRFKAPARIGEVAFSPDGKLAVAGLDDSAIHLWDISTGAELGSFDGHKESIHTLTFTKDSSQLLSCSRDGTVRLWDAPTRTEIRRFEGHEGQVWAARISPDGKRVLTGCHDKKIRLFDLKTGDLEKVLAGHEHNVWCVEFAPDGRRALSCSEDKTIRLWDLENGKQIGESLTLDYKPRRVAWSRTGDQFLSAGWGGESRAMGPGNQTADLVERPRRGHSLWSRRHS